MPPIDQIHLASRSPRRAELLQQMGIPFAHLDIEVDESMQPGESAIPMVARLAELKARAGAKMVGTAQWVLAADTVVAVDGQVLGKPLDDDDVRRMLSQLSGTLHEVLTGVSLAGSGSYHGLVSCTRVRFRTLSGSEIDNYIASGEPMDKAGAYAIQGLGGVFVEMIEGSFSGVVGLPVFETYALIKNHTGLGAL